MAATDAGPSSALQALTAAALLLPGLLASATQAADAPALNLQLSRYEEGERELIDVESGMQPLRADTLHLSGDLMLRDRIRFAFGLTQDTWSGATPIAVAPLAADGNRPVLRDSAQGVVVSGASPLINGRLPLDGNRAVIGDARNVLIMSSASPELRREADVTLDIPVAPLHGNPTLVLGAGMSDEPDYRSYNARLGGRFAFNEQATTLKLGTAFTHSDTAARFDADVMPYLTRGAYLDQLENGLFSQVLHGERRDRALDIGITQVLDAVSVFDAGVALTRGSGFMENPYKTVTVVFTGAVPGNVSGDVRAFLEQRPDERRQLAWRAHYARHFAQADATLQLDYNQSRDDWGIDTHSLELGWAQSFGQWTLTPRIRYYTQTAAEFHTDWLVSEQSYRSIRRDASGRELWFNFATGTLLHRDASGRFSSTDGRPLSPIGFDPQPLFDSYSPALLPAHFSSDHRLADFGSVSAGLTVQREFARGISLEAGFEYYRRAGGLDAEGTGDSSYADFDFAMANLTLTVDLQATARRQRREQIAQDHSAHAQQVSHAAPAGLMFAHAAPVRGNLMTGYRVSHLRQHGELLGGSRSADDAAVVAQGCRPASRCTFAPARMTMTMHMFDLMYAVNDSFALMLMPQYMTMDMRLRALDGAPVASFGAHNHGVAAHVSGALGDTLIGGVFTPGVNHALTATLAISIPTGKTDLEFRRSFQADGGLMHYDMQTGSGTWDLLPALTWNATRGAWQHGAQLSGIKRLEDRNDQDYRFGDQLQVSGWTTRALTGYLSASLRALWQHRGETKGAFNAYNAGQGPMDFAGNYGGEFVDIGLGVNLELAGSRLAVEWLAPVHENVNGFQLERQGTLSASWHYNY